VIAGLPTVEAVSKEGRPIWIRPARESDAADLHALQVALMADGRGQVLGPADLPDRDRYAERLFGRLEAKDALYVVCLDTEAGRIAAEGSVTRLGPAFLRHVADLGIGVHPDHQERGLGRALCSVLLDAARLAGVERLQLGVRADNPRAIALYRSLGFDREAVRTRFVKLPDGRYVDDWTMVRWLDR
jgi:putative acetyltransferase